MFWDGDRELWSSITVSSICGFATPQGTASCRPHCVGAAWTPLGGWSSKDESGTGTWVSERSEKSSAPLRAYSISHLFPDAVDTERYKPRHTFYRKMWMWIRRTAQMQLIVWHALDQARDGRVVGSYLLHVKTRTY